MPLQEQKPLVQCVESGPRVKPWWIAGMTLAVIGAQPMYEWVRFALASDLYSYVLLVPFISGYLVWQQRHTLDWNARGGHLAPALPVLVAGMLFAAAYFVGNAQETAGNRNDWFSLKMLAVLCCVWSVFLFLFGTRSFRSVAFPMLFLAFMIPIPLFIESSLEWFFQQNSAWMTHLLLKLSGTPVFRDGTGFQVPGFAFDIAPECSGIRSNLVLFITALLAGHLLLKNTFGKVLLAAAVVVIGIVRNAVRIFTLAQLCVHVDPAMIHSPLHQRGGPLFFALSLVPLFIMLWLLRRRETRATSI